jgi:hypothetical protein
MQGGEIDAEHQVILDECRLDGSYGELRREALLRLLAAGANASKDAGADRRAVAREKNGFRTQRGLFRQADLVAWTQANGTDLAGFERMMNDRAAVESIAQLRDAELHAGMLDRLRELDLYPQLRDRATKRRQAARGAPNIPRVSLVTWYFATRLSMPVPDDIADYAASIGIEDVESFYELLAADRALIASEARMKDANA